MSVRNECEICFTHYKPEDRKHECDPEDLKEIIAILHEDIESMPLEGFRVVDTDNYGGDYPNEKFVAIGIPTEEMAVIIANVLNDRYSGYGKPRFYKVVPEDYELAPGFEP